MINSIYIVDYSHIDRASALDEPFYVRCSGYHELEQAHASFSGSAFYEGAILKTGDPLCFVPFSESWQGKDVVLQVESIGSLRMILTQMELLKSLRLRLCLRPSVGADMVKVLSSSGLWCCIDYRDQQVDWDAMASLSEYALSESPPENRIEPFACIADRYKPETGAVIPHAGLERFDAAFETDLDDGELAISTCTIKALLNEDGDASMDSEWLWREEYNLQFSALEDDECRSCAAFRLCRSSINKEHRESGACEKFFTTLMGQIEAKQSKGRG